jgi:ornithine cyclodeaminase
MERAAPDGRRAEGGAVRRRSREYDDAWRRGIVILGEAEVARALAGQEDAVVEIVRQAYEIHQEGDTVLPESVFLRLPGDDGARIIALPAYIGGGFQLAGLKWIASFPNNRALGLERASGTIILNSTRTGRALAVLGGATISAERTAASAALAATLLWEGDPPRRIGVIGCGRISWEILSFLARCWPVVSRLFVYDTAVDQMTNLLDRCAHARGDLRVHACDTLAGVLAAGVDVLIVATTALRPHIFDLGRLPPRLVLHISLRDLAPALIARCRNVVDDVNHVCRERTSIHLAAEQCGHRRFVDATLGELITRERAVSIADTPVVFSPFGLGILDVAVSRFVYERAQELALGIVVDADRISAVSA